MMTTAKSPNNSGGNGTASPKPRLTLSIPSSSIPPSPSLPSLLENDNNNNNSSSNNSNPNNTKNVFRPVVFQCRQCRSIVADSADLLSADPLHRIVAFRRTCHPNITIKPEWQLRQDGIAFGSVFQTLSCKNCDTELGVRYHTTNADTDHLRGFLTLKTESLLMYELQFDDDEVKKGIEAAFSNALPPPPPLASSSSSSSSLPSADPSTKRNLELFEVEITKLQKFCLVLYDRVVRLEEQVIALTAAKL